MADEDNNKEAEIERLKNEVEEWKSKYERATRWLRLLKKAFTAWGLTQRIIEYRDTASPSIPLPQPQTEALLAAILNRSLVGTFLSILISVGTVSILAMQTYVLGQQATILEKQYVATTWLEAETEERERLKHFYSVMAQCNGPVGPEETIEKIEELREILLESQGTGITDEARTRIDFLFNSCELRDLGIQIDAWREWLNALDKLESLRRLQQ